MQKPESFKSYEEMTAELKKVCRGLFGIGGDSNETPKVQETQETPKVQETPKTPEVNIPVAPAKSESLDDLLNSL